MSDASDMQFLFLSQLKYKYLMYQFIFCSLFVNIIQVFICFAMVIRRVLRGVVSETNYNRFLFQIKLQSF